MPKLNINNSKQYDEVCMMIDALIAKQSSDWKAISAAVTAKYKVTNFLDVRSCVQRLLDSEMIKRDASVHVELYHSVK